MRIFDFFFEILFILILLSAVGCLEKQEVQENLEDKFLTENTGKIQEGLSKEIGQEIKNSLEENRKTYGIPLAAYENLPFPPQDFEAMLAKIRTSNSKNYTFFSADYYLQPEFYPSFPKHALSYWQNPNTTHYAAMGYGIHPSHQKIEIKPGETLVARFFVHSGFGVRSWQGMKIKAINSSRNSEIETEVLQKDFLFGPNFPKFTGNWANAVDVKIFAHQNIKPGNYNIILLPDFPSAEASSKWSQIYGARYFNAASAGAELSHKIEIVVASAA